MTGEHGGYSDEELAAVTAYQAGAAKDSFADLGERLSEKEQPLTAETNSEPPAPASAPEVKTDAPQTVKRRKKVNTKVVEEFLKRIPEQAFKSGGIELDADEKPVAEWAVEFLLEMFGFQIEIPESDIIIRSKIVALFLPLLVLAALFVKHKAPAALQTVMENAKQNNSGNRPEGERKNGRSVPPVAANSPSGDLQPGA